MKARLEQRDRAFVERLHRLGSATVRELCESLGVTATAVRQRLNRLEPLGFVEWEDEAQRRGRPVHRYRLTDSGRRALGDNYAELAMILWRELQSIEHEPTRDLVLQRVREQLISHYSTGVSPQAEPTERARQLVGELHSRGFDVEVKENGGLPILREHSCPYLDVAQMDDSICQLETEVFEHALGMKLELTSRCVDGHSCCEFVPAEPSGEVGA